MGLARGCCRFVCATAVVPLAIIIAALLEAPSVQTFVADPADAAAAAAVGASDVAASDLQDGAKAGASTSATGHGSGGMFDRIAFAYDSTNKWMSLGLDQFWRRTLVDDCMRLSPGDRVLDLATGTADVGILIGSRLRDLANGTATVGGEGAVLGVDPSAEMLRRGVSKVEAAGLEGVVRLTKGDAQDLSIVSGIDAAGVVEKLGTAVQAGSIDKISMAFGIRNVPDRVKAFGEMRRVLQKRAASRVCILEFSLPSGDSFLSKTAHAFITHAVPFIGKLATMNSGGEEYQYLERSILEFPQPPDFAALMTRQGLSVLKITSFAYGSVHLFEATPAAVA